MNTKKTNQLVNVILISLIIITLIGVVQSVQLKNIVEQKLSELKEFNRPAEIKIIRIEDAVCNDCYDFSGELEQVKQQNIMVEQELILTIDQAQELIEKYDIEIVPTFIITGEIDKLNKNNLGQEQDVLILRDVGYPNYNIQENKVQGKVGLIVISKEDCSECSGFEELITNLKSSGLSVSVERRLNYQDTEAKGLIEDYNITILPHMLLSSDFRFYDLADRWNTIGLVYDDGTYGLNAPMTPYYNLTSNKLVGLVSVIYLVDESCDTCYDVNAHNKILRQLGIYISENKTLDVSDSKGEALISKYNITKVPTIILIGDLEVYSQFRNAWKDVGTVEKDGSYVFRKPELLSPEYETI